MSRKKGKLFLLIGPSGVGKGTYIAELKKQHSDWVFPVSVTTRSKRPEEEDGKTYYFYSKAKFEHSKKTGDFLEWACVHGKNYYGLLKKTVFDALDKGKVVFREIDIQGFKSIRTKIDTNHLVSIFLLPPSLDILRERIKNRSPLSEEEIERRIASAKIEIELATECDYQVQTIDNRIIDNVAEIERIVAKESGLE